MASISLDIGKAASRSTSIVIRLTGVRRFRIRFTIALAIMRLAGWIMPVPVAVEVDNEARA